MTHTSCSINLTSNRKYSPGAILQLICWLIQWEDSTLIQALVSEQQALQPEGGDSYQRYSPCGNRVQEKSEKVGAWNVTEAQRRQLWLHLSGLRCVHLLVCDALSHRKWIVSSNGALKWPHSNICTSKHANCSTHARTNLEIWSPCCQVTAPWSQCSLQHQAFIFSSLQPTSFHVHLVFHTLTDTQLSGDPIAWESMAEEKLSMNALC